MEQEDQLAEQKREINLQKATRYQLRVNRSNNVITNTISCRGRIVSSHRLRAGIKIHSNVLLCSKIITAFSITMSFIIHLCSSPQMLLLNDSVAKVHVNSTNIFLPLPIHLYGLIIVIIIIIIIIIN